MNSRVHTDFSRALAVEVRMLLDEVDKVREERRSLQHEIEYLTTVKSKYDSGGEFFYLRGGARGWGTPRATFPPVPGPFMDPPYPYPASAVPLYLPSRRLQTPPLRSPSLDLDGEGPGLLTPPSPQNTSPLSDHPALPPTSPIAEPILLNFDSDPAFLDLDVAEQKKDLEGSLEAEDSRGSLQNDLSFLPETQPHTPNSTCFEDLSSSILRHQWSARQPDPALVPTLVDGVPLKTPHSASPEKMGVHLWASQYPENFNYLSDMLGPHSDQREEAYMSGGDFSANEQYLYEISKALSLEVCLLLREFDKMYHERRTILYNLAKSMETKSKCGPDTKYNQYWAPRGYISRPSEHEDVPGWRMWWRETGEPMIQIQPVRDLDTPVVIPDTPRTPDSKLSNSQPVFVAEQMSDIAIEEATSAIPELPSPP